MRILYLLMGACGAVSGGWIAMLVWLNGRGFGPDEVLSWLIIFGCTTLPVVLCVLVFRNRSVHLPRLLLYVAGAMALLFLLGPMISAHRITRIRILGENPFSMVFRPWSYVIGAWLGLPLGLWSHVVFRAKRKEEDEATEAE